ncbi:extradiol dioxygenase [Alicyclobacillus hesperidum]|uniref:AmmeMemoRadiSam system protein B n=1 Tax=Alicyclobacillus hesperidum TaxID=89784 RepID=A0A1H2S3W3_9BACL|nr:extradiol ring-cleavage dioxygenase [Alicyclobacillus hesperidum]GLV13366.1 extradiol dioxygenase [Alicyclobacillus hesperidum]SDW25844.1 AmmeMemoRadiSam system protein B [Alicyclobacillus hesperidum]
MASSSVVFACITPHGLPILKELAGDEPHLMAKTRASMEKLGQQMRAEEVDVIVVITPHGLRADNQFTIAASSFMEGELSELTVAQMVGNTRLDVGERVHMRRVVDQAFARAIGVASNSASLPMAVINFATQKGVFSTLPLDWGSLIPLSFMPDMPIVVVNSARSRTYQEHIRLGEQIARVATSMGRRIAIIASCDWSHTHDPSGPYGWHPDAAVLDDSVVACISRGDLEELMQFSEEIIENAKPDGIWQALVLAGAVPPSARRPRLLSYERPTYFGMICARML